MPLWEKTWGGGEGEEYRAASGEKGREGKKYRNNYSAMSWTGKHLSRRSQN